MRTYLLVVAAGLLLSAPAFAQPKKGVREFSGGAEKPQMTDEEVRAAKRAALGVKDVRDWSAMKAVPEKPFPWGTVIFGVVLLGAAVPFALKQMKSTKGELDEIATFGVKKSAQKSDAGEGKKGFGMARPRKGAEAAPAADEAAAGDDDRTTRDRVWDALSSAPNWVTADWVAKNAGLSADEVVDEIGALVHEGYAQENKDRSGRPVFKVAS